MTNHDIPLEDGIVPNLSPEISIDNAFGFLNTSSNDRSDGWIDHRQASGLWHLCGDTLTVCLSLC